MASDQVGFLDSASRTSRESMSTGNEYLSLISLLVPARALSGSTGRKGVHACGKVVACSCVLAGEVYWWLESVISSRMRPENRGVLRCRAWSIPLKHRACHVDAGEVEGCFATIIDAVCSWRCDGIRSSSYIIWRVDEM